MISVAQKLNTIEEWCQDQSCVISAKKLREQRPQPRKNLSWVRVPVKIVSVALKLSTIEERSQDESCLFRRGNYKNKVKNPENLPWVRVLVKIVYVAR
jgi:hypothetical protein